ncbi:unnamed protein product [Phytomonas sp. EM1]|nr:unnamed protein product [Phytomonas sp. EM1]|eukprot:CCW65115.1 unnamed protein product [Phytomonas sp. isolate EM1]
MQSQLASQLQKLQQRPVDDKRLTDSFLFSKSDTKSYSREQVLQLAANGLQTLISIDNRFHPFLDDLFNPKKTRQERRLLHADESKALDLRLDHFLTLLSPHLFLTAAHQVFEYLVRVHEVHVYNVETVLRAFLPYHDHNIFARALLLLDLRDTGLDFLSTNQEHGAPLLREHLVTACAESRKVLRLVCMTMAAPARLNIQHNAANALFAAVATALSTHPDAESIWRILLPFEVEFLTGGSVPASQGGPSSSSIATPSRETICTSLLVLSAWGTEVRFSQPTMSAIMRPIVSILVRSQNFGGTVGISSVPLPDLLLLIDGLLESQKHMVDEISFTPHVVSLLALPWPRWIPLLSQTFEDAAAKGTVLFQFLFMLLSRFCLQRLRVAHSISSIPSDVQTFLLCAATELPLSKNLVKEYLLTALQCGRILGSEVERRDRVLDRGEGERRESPSTPAEDSNEKRDLLANIIFALERRYQSVFDSTLSEVLSDPSMIEASTRFLTAHLRGTRYQMVHLGSTCARGGIPESLPIFACLLHPLPEVRKVAAGVMDGMTTEQLCSTRHGDISGEGSADSSLVGLLAHAAECESDRGVAEHFLNTAALAVSRLTRALNEVNGDNNACRGGVIIEDDKLLFYDIAIKKLLRSLYIMGAQIDITVQTQYFNRILSPLLEEYSLKSSPGSVSEPARMRKRGTIGMPENDTFETAITNVQAGNSSVLYYTILLYISLTSASQLPPHQSANEEESVELIQEKLVRSLEVMLLKCFPSLAHIQGRISPSCNTLGTKFNVKCSKKELVINEGQAREAKGILPVLETPEVMQSVTGEATERAEAAFRVVVSLLNDNAATAAQVEMAVSEFILVTAASLMSDLPGAAENLLQFFIGAPRQGALSAFNRKVFNHSARQGDRGEDNSNQGYLSILHQVQRINVDQDSMLGEGKSAVGRGQPNNLLSSYCLPSNNFTMRFSVVLLGLVGALLEYKRATNLSALCSVLQLLGYLKAPLPGMVDHLEALAPAFLVLLDLSLGQRPEALDASMPPPPNNLPVDWYALIRDAVFGPVRHAEPLSEAMLSTTSILSPLAVCLFLPLCASTSQREAILQQLQDTILRVMAVKKRKGTVSEEESSAFLFLSAVFSKTFSTEGLNSSVTTLNSFVESMAREESRFLLTNDAAELAGAILAEMLRVEVDQVATNAAVRGLPLVPYRLATTVIEFFFDAPSVSAIMKGKIAFKKTFSSFPFLKLIPCVEQLLQVGAGPRHWLRKGKSIKDGEDRGDDKAVESELSLEAADFLEAICRRSIIHVPVANSAILEPSQHAAVRLWMLLLKYPYLRIRGDVGLHTAMEFSSVRPLYRHSLTALSVALQAGLDASSNQGNVLIFTQKKTDKESPLKSKKTDDLESKRRRFAMDLAALVSPVLFDSVLHIGSDVARLCVGTKGGYERVFLPALKQETMGTSLEVLHELLRTLVPSTLQHSDRETGWQPPSECLLSNPLHYSETMSIIGFVRNQLNQLNDCRWTCTKRCLLLLKVLSTLLQVLPTVQCDDDSDESLLSIVMAILGEFPLDSMCLLLSEDPFIPSDSQREEEFDLDFTPISGSRAVVNLYTRQVFLYLKELTTLCVEQAHALSENDPRGTFKVRSTILKQGLALIVSLLSTHSSTGAQLNDAVTQTSNKTEAEVRGGAQVKVDIISELLRGLSPLLVPQQKPGSVHNFHSSGNNLSIQQHFFLHIPLVAFLIKLEPMEFTETLQYRSVIEVCQQIITSFDIHTQIYCIAGLMRLVMDPHGQLSAPSAAYSSPESLLDSEEATNRRPSTQFEESERNKLLHLLRKMVKPNQIINRQELLLNVINMTLKSNAFLEPFIELLYHSNRSNAKALGRDRPAYKNAEGHHVDDELEDPHAPEDTQTNQTCMHLLASSLELYSHYSDLNLSTPESGENTTQTGEDDSFISEEKSYTMLLELLAGNTLACVLASINESTFVKCLNQLLSDARVVMQIKGLEVLLDRLHHSLPTEENIISDQEMEQRRKDLRDPKKKLTLEDLVRVKARPLTTKRSFTLFPQLTTLLQLALRSSASFTKKVIAHSFRVQSELTTQGMFQLFRISQLSISCIEELVRIVGSGGSMQAEKTLANANRSKRMTEELLAKLLGNKACVRLVHEFVTNVCVNWIPSVAQGFRSILNVATGDSSEATPPPRRGFPSYGPPLRKVYWRP